MNNTIFDLIDEPIPEGKEGYFEIASRAPAPKDKSFLNNVKDYSKTILKGSIEGLTALGHAMGPSDHHQHGIPKKQTEQLDELLPTDEGYTQKALRRGLKQLPLATASPFSNLATIPRAIGAGFAGEGAKELGLGEGWQIVAELTAYIGPDITRKLLEKGKNKDLIKYAKEMGMTDEEITPLIQSEFKQKWLSKITTKGSSTQEKLKGTKSALDTVYGGIIESPEAVKEIAEKANGKLLNGIFEKLNDMPREVRGKIEADLNDLLNNKITGKSLMNFWKDINANLSGNTKQLSLLKDHVKEAISSISPKLAKDFEMVNTLYTKYYPIASKLKPTIVDQIVTGGEILGGISALGAVTMGHYQPLVGIIGEQAARKVSQLMLTNPHFQQLSHKMINAMNENKFEIVRKLTKSFSDQFKKISPELSKELDSLTDEELQYILKAHHSEEK